MSDVRFNVCEKCGKTDLNFHGNDKKNCPRCYRGGPWCRKCLLHHYKHHDDEDVEFDENCSDCDNALDDNNDNDNNDDLSDFIVPG